MSIGSGAVSAVVTGVLGLGIGTGIELIVPHRSEATVQEQLIAGSVQLGLNGIAFVGMQRLLGDMDPCCGMVFLMAMLPGQPELMNTLVNFRALTLRQFNTE